jgi:hypothetical protein
MSRRASPQGGFCFPRGNAYHSLKSSLCSCVSITLPGNIVNANLQRLWDAHPKRQCTTNQLAEVMKARPERRRRETAMLVERAWSALRESRKLLEQLEGQLKQTERFIEDIQVHIKQVWKRKDNGLLVKVSGLIYQEPKRVMWRGLPDRDNPSAYGTVTETEFKEQYEYQPQKSPYQLIKQIRRNNNDHETSRGRCMPIDRGAK